MKGKFVSKIKRKVLPIMCSSFASFGLVSPRSNADSFLRGVNDLLDATMKIGTLFMGSKQMMNQAKEGMKSRICEWAPGLSADLFYDLHDEDKSAALGNWDWATSNVKGRKKFKEMLRGIGKEFLLAKSNQKLQQNSHNNRAILLNGPSGTSKTFLGELFARFMVKDGLGRGETIIDQNSGEVVKYGEPKVPKKLPDSIMRISGLDIDPNVKKHPWLQLLSNNSNSTNKSLVLPSALGTYMRNNPNGGIIIIDEFDKLGGTDINNPLCKTVLREFCEGLRNILDTGRLTVNGETLDLSNYIFILTSNIDPDCLRPSKRLTVEELEKFLSGGINLEDMNYQTKIDLSPSGLSNSQKDWLVSKNLMEDYRAKEKPNLNMNAMRSLLNISNMKDEQTYASIMKKHNLNENDLSQLRKLDLKKILTTKDTTISENEKKSLGYTKMDLDVSFLNRLTVLDFDIMSPDELLEIFLDDLNAWNDAHVDLNVQAKVSEKNRKYLANLFYNSKKGARAPVDMFKQLLPQLYSIEMDAVANQNLYSELVTYDLSYDFVGGWKLSPVLSENAKEKSGTHISASSENQNAPILENNEIEETSKN